MKRGIPIILVVLILQTISFFITETKAQLKDLAETKGKEEIQRILKLRIEVKSEEQKPITSQEGRQGGGIGLCVRAYFWIRNSYAFIESEFVILNLKPLRR